MHPLPVLYSFRRCPYAIRARMALAYAHITVELREVLLKDKPVSMLQASPKATVPVLVLPDGQVIDESLELMHWALQQSDPRAWLDGTDDPQARQWLNDNDGPFKACLDKYKYAERFPEHDRRWYRSQAEPFLKSLDTRLQDSTWLSGAKPGLIDVALFPFIRQFAGVEPAWFRESPYPALRQWLQSWLDAPLFRECMHKHPPWKSGQAITIFPAPAHPEQTSAR